MTSLPAISVQAVSKQYRIGARADRHRTFGETIAAAASAPLRRLRNRAAAPPREDMIWALKDVSFEVQPGEVVGVIGRNGAGKSTLLRVLSEITPPTKGRVEIRGRVGSLLEVGTGFHPELTGRENVFLNGAILGMHRAEITRKFDEIIAFAEVERFIDTPVKRYSSGMYVRLAFAVAAHLEPEILLVDEVLAVGDAQFQRKCMGKMGEVARLDGRTILFVSHNLAAIRDLCQRTVVIDGGRVYCIRDAADACDDYTRLISGGEESLRHGVVRGGSFELSGVRVEGEAGRMPAPLAPATFTVPIRFQARCGDPHVHVFVQSSDGETIFGLSSGELLGGQTWPPAQEFAFRFRVERLPLLPGLHGLAVKIRSNALGINETLHIGTCFEVAEAPVYGSAHLSRRWHGLAVVDASAGVTPGP